MEKQKVSAFEYAIREVAEPQTLHKFRPETKEEEQDRREDKIRQFFRKVKVKTN